ncbi:hypothetical protein FB45DRAFT_1029636 [Roridomyces roridus]|uniref:Uncharacterized protein n=1 Tax=Roridomyces roridus TaxID=1738132 RepID=A0AAD7BQG1_9AGAR|nr:hypothetical protein FB45DRAFT_1029636 [Roridomyces roridus]
MSTSSSPAKTQATKKLTIEWTPPVGPVGAPSRSFFDFFRGSDCVGSANYVLRVAHKEEEVGSKIWCQSVIEKITPFVRTALNSWESPKAVSGSTFLFFRGLKRVYQGSGKSDPDYESFPWPPSTSASFAKVYQLETDHKSPHTLLSTAKAPSFKTIFQGRAPPSPAKPSPVKPPSKRKPDDSVSEEEEDDESIAGSVTPPPAGKKGSGKPASKKRRANVEVEDDHSEEEEGPSFAVVVPPRPKSSRSGAKSRRPSSTIDDQQLDIVPEDQPLTWKTMNNDQKVEHLTIQLRKLARKIILERDTWHVTSVPGSIPGYVLSLSFTRANGNTKLRLYDHMHESSAQAKSAASESTVPEPLIPHTATDEAGGLLSTSVDTTSEIVQNARFQGQSNSMLIIDAGAEDELLPTAGEDHGRLCALLQPSYSSKAPPPPPCPTDIIAQVYQSPPAELTQSLDLPPQASARTLSLILVSSLVRSTTTPNERDAVMPTPVLLQILAAIQTGTEARVTRMRTRSRETGLGRPLTASRNTSPEKR